NVFRIQIYILALISFCLCVFFFQAEDGIRDRNVTGVQTCALPISPRRDHCWRRVEGNPGPPALLAGCRLELPDFGPRRFDSFRWRGTAHSLSDANRLRSSRCPLCARRAIDWLAPAR